MAEEKDVEEKDVEKPSGEGKRKFSFPTAFTILFILLFLIAAATWLIPAGSYDYNEDGEPVPGTYHQVESNPQRLLASALKGPINGMYGIEDESGNVDVLSFVCNDKVERGCLWLFEVVGSMAEQTRPG